jgi:hypothetical protein
LGLGERDEKKTTPEMWQERRRKGKLNVHFKILEQKIDNGKKSSALNIFVD